MASWSGTQSRASVSRRTHSWPMPPSLVCGAGAVCGIAAGWGGLACTGGSSACDGGALRWRAGATCGVAPLGSGLASTGGWPACDGGALRWPKFGFCVLQSATSCKLICGKGLLARRGCGVPRMMGTMQSTKRPSPDPHKSRLLASCPDFSAGPLAWGRLHGDSRTQTDDKHTEDGSPNLISVLYRSMRQLQN